MNPMLVIVAYVFPFFVFLVSLYYLIFQPKMDDKLFGYRTERSMKNEFIYQKAQILFGRQLLFGSLVAALFGYGFLAVTNTLVKVLLIIAEFVAVTNFGIFTEFILIKKYGR